MLILGIILFGMIVGAGAQLILGRSHGRIDWTKAIVAGLVGSFIGGLLISLLSGDGLDLKPSGIVGSLAGAIVVNGGVALVGRPGQADRGGSCPQTLGRPSQSQATLTQQVTHSRQVRRDAAGGLGPRLAQLVASSPSPSASPSHGF